MTKALGKEGSFAEGRSIALGKDFFKKNKISATFLCQGPWLEALGKDFFFKKLKFLCRGPTGKPSAKIFQKKKRIILCRGPPETALDKDSVPGAGAVTAAFLCRVPLQPSAKALPSAR